jgi:hypothetical protein
MKKLQNRRILLIDDQPSIHQDFRKILSNPAAQSGLDDVEAALFGAPALAPAVDFELDSAYQGAGGRGEGSRVAASQSPTSWCLRTAPLLS